MGHRAGARASRRSADEILRHLPEPVLVVEADATIAYANPKAASLLGLPAGRAAGRSVRDHLVRAQSGDLDAVLAGTAPAGPMEVLLKRSDGSLFPAVVRLSPLPEGDRPRAVIMAVADLAERQTLRAQLERAQRLESLGTLAAGIAHDFNNSLTTILGYTQLALSGLRTQHPAASEHLNVAIDEVRRAADLVRQLLSFGRRSHVQEKVVDLADAVREHMRTIGRTLPETIAVTTRLPDAPALTFVDPTQVQQVLVNLVVNARDAMPSGGTLSIGIEEVDAGARPSADALGVRPGRYHALTVSDTGLGIPAEIIDRIFDPFYSTKSLEQGSGLGLSVVWGIIHQQGGHVTVRSAPGQGTTFTVYWPRFEERRATPRLMLSDEPLRGTETILLIEDHASAREATAGMLRSLGYTVLTAENGEEALALFQQRRNEVDLIISDLVLPGLRGARLVDALREIEPGARILFTTGYGTIDDERELTAAGVHGMLLKPLDLYEVSMRVRRALTRRP